MKPSGLEVYRDRFLMANLPRAWAIASDGSAGGQGAGGTIEKTREAALKSCVDKGGTDCAIYAENLDVVWRGRKGHSGAVGPGFAEKFGACIARFVMGASQSASCDANP